jgi:small-conductance mechanosensitive channel
MLDVASLQSLPLFSNSLSAWLIAATIALGTFGVLFAARSAVRRYLRKLKSTPQSELLEVPAGVLSRTTLAFFVVVSVGVGMRALTLGPVSQRVIGSAMTIALFWQAGVWTMAAVQAWLDRRRRRGMNEDRAALSSLNIISFILNVVVWAIVLLLTLDNLGVNITALVAGLGIGGIAVALALQNVLGDLFASLSITLDKPFELGEFLAVDDYLGAVEHIGIKSTRLRSLGGEQIILANGDLLKSRVRNYGRMKERRVVFTTGVTYETSVEQIERIPQLIREIIDKMSETRFDRSHFQKHGESSLDFETVYYVLSPDFNRYMDVQQQINLHLHRGLAQLGVEFAYPTRRIVN